MARFRQDFPEHQRRSEGEAADNGQRNAPVKEISKHTAEQASAHPADRVPANVQPHGEGHEARVDLLAEIGHPDRRHAAQG